MIEKKCKSCKTDNDNDANHCKKCGKPLEEMIKPPSTIPPEPNKQVCLICNKENIIDAKFCEECGKPLKPETKSNSRFLFLKTKSFIFTKFIKDDVPEIPPEKPLKIEEGIKL